MRWGGQNKKNYIFKYKGKYQEIGRPFKAKCKEKGGASLGCTAPKDYDLQNQITSIPIETKSGANASWLLILIELVAPGRKPSNSIRYPQ